MHFVWAVNETHRARTGSDMTETEVVRNAGSAVGLEAHGSPGAKLAQQVTGLLPDVVAEKFMERAGVVGELSLDGRVKPEGIDLDIQILRPRQSFHSAWMRANENTPSA